MRSDGENSATMNKQKKYRVCGEWKLKWESKSSAYRHLKELENHTVFRNQLWWVESKRVNRGRGIQYEY